MMGSRRCLAQRRSQSTNRYRDNTGEMRTVIVGNEMNQQNLFFPLIQSAFGHPCNYLSPHPRKNTGHVTRSLNIVPTLESERGEEMSCCKLLLTLIRLVRKRFTTPDLPLHTQPCLDQKLKKVSLRFVRGSDKIFQTNYSFSCTQDIQETKEGKEEDERITTRFDSLPPLSRPPLALLR